jgi:hypothetical protein
MISIDMAVTGQAGPCRGAVGETGRVIRCHVGARWIAIS